MNSPEYWDLDQRLRDSLGSPPPADFDRWRARHGDVVAYLNPVVTMNYRRRRRIIMRITSATVAAAVIVVVATMLVVPQQASLAQAAEAIDKATTIAWTNTIYERLYSQDGKHTWLRTTRHTNAYRHPGLYRSVYYDDEGNVSRVQITDSKIDKTLILDMGSRTAIWTTHPPLMFYDPYARGPFYGVADALKNKPLELVGQRDVNGGTANVFRYHQSGDDSSFDVWIDADSKQLVGHSSPGADVFDPRSMADRDNPAEPKLSTGKMLGGIVDEIVFDANSDAALFSLTPPEGFEVVEEPPTPTVTEAEMIEWLDATTHFNDGTFSDASEGLDYARFNEANAREKVDRTEAEQTMIDLLYRHAGNHNRDVLASFASEYAVDGTFRYLGKGVTLGDADRIVLFYKLKSTGTYRAVYGDLTVKDIAPEDLPLPVDE